MTDEAGSRGVFAVESPQPPMPDETLHSTSRKPRWKRRVTLVFALITLIAAAIVLPPLVNISRYQRQITAVMSRSLGRPVHLSGVELRLLPRPGFVLHDLSVSEDPKFGAEPILSARTVAAAIRISSLWQGRLTVNRISVDEASLNLVRSAQGQWNLQSVMMGSLMEGKQGGPEPANPAIAPKPSVFARRPVPFPYLEATNSRVNLKNGVEKSPFSIVNTELSLWQDDPGIWRLRLRGQPARTDMEISSGDTGEVQVEATLNATSTRELRQMPFKLQVAWREAQLGQLSRLLLGSDAGWRGDLTADIEVQGTPDAAQTKARLRATSVRREEFAPETPLDFDANCSFRYQHAQNAIHDLGCDTAIGDGLLHLKADLPGASGKPEAMLEVRQLPLQAGLDLLRTVRSGFAPGITARGTANGSLSLMTGPPSVPKAGGHRTQARQSQKAGKSAKNGSGELNLQGSLIVEGGELRGGALKQPIRLPKMAWTPTLISSPVSSPVSSAADGSVPRTGLGSRFTVSLGSATSAESPTPAPASAKSTATPLPQNSQAQSSQAKTHPPQAFSRPYEITVRMGLTADGYDVGFGGSAGIAELRDIAYAFGAPHLDAADNLAAGAADIDFTAAGPWIASGNLLSLEAVSSSISPRVPASTTASASSAAPDPAPARASSSGHLAGAFQIHHAQWKASYLAQPLEFPLGTIAITDGAIAMTSGFSYGVLNGTVIVNAALECITSTCQPQIHLHLGAMDAGAVQTALLGVPEKKGLLSPLMDRMRTADKPKWPTAILDIQAESLILGPTTVSNPAIRLKTDGSEIQLESWEGALLGGTAKGQGRFSWTGDGPKYAIEGDFTKLSAASLGAVLQGPAEDGALQAWSGGPLSGHGSVEFSGLTDKQLAASASGSVHFSWPHGSIPAQTAISAKAAMPAKTPTTADPATPRTEVHFDDWSGTVTIHNGEAQLAENAMRQGKRIASVTGVIPFGSPAKLAVASPGGKGNPSHAAASPAVQ